MKLLKLLRQKCQHRIFMLTMVWLAGIAIGHSQNSTITGTVTDESGQPLAGANILIKGTSVGAQTDFDGLFSISASSSETLVVSYLGFVTQEIPINGRTSITISLAEDASQLDEVVIVGYGAQKKSDLTGAVSTVSSKDIEKYTFTDPAQALQGKMAGVNVQSQGGSPGATSIITIRGAGTLGDSSPLFVIDGVITGNMNSINPADIESISVLKDASSTAIYGSRAANGVIIVTTKRGKKGQLSIDLDTSYGFNQVINELNWANARQYADIVNRADDNDGNSRSPANDTQFNPNNTSDLYKESLRTSSVKNTNLRLSGGGEHTLYSLSLNHFDNEGVVKFSDFKRTTVRATGSFTKNRFRLENTIGLTRTVNNPNNFFNKERNLIPTIRLKDDNGDWSSSDLPDGEALGAFYGPGTIINELGIAALQDRTVTRNTILGNIAASYEIIDGLTYKLSLGLESFADNNYEFTPEDQIFKDSNIKQFSELRERNTNFLSTLIEHTLNYKKTFGKHTIDALAGFTEQENNTRQLGVVARRFPSNNIRVASAAEELQEAPSFDRTSTIQSYFGRLNYSFDDRYLLTATVRRDGSSLFREDLRWGTFPSMALAWNLSNEGFMENFDAITNIKLRASYGEIGSNNVDIYSTDPELNLFSEYVLGTGDQARVTGYSITKGVNPSIFWETTKTTDIGLDFNALNNKLSITMDYFIKESEDILIPIQLPLYTGFTNAIPFNTANVENKGFEFVASYSDQLSDDFSFNISANFSTLDNKVTDLGGSSPILQGSFTSNTINSTKTDVGQPIGSFFGYVVEGIYQTDAEATAANDGPGSPVAGDLRFKDLDGDGDIDADDQTYLGSPIPTFEYGFSIGANYKQFDLNLFFNGVSGNSILNGTKYRGYFDNEGNYFADALNAWTPTNTNTNIPRNTKSDNGRNKRMSDFYIENGAYFRLRNAQIGYNFSNTILDKLNLNKLRLYVSATNLFTITGYEGYYPEVGRNGRGGNSSEAGRVGSKIFNAGVDEGTYPTPRTYQLGLQVSF
ncbi:SusC/RagA family TonB-linked outer membrane protein [Flavivirga algicola]|uniref:TonB-dependent receptor n=1 Tax=Flavivirga algicola TaxID=2729136 RepID=A0ABX1S1R9_9FLAO|nr:TonB-dependent receptor [Flavivirga algicola]NMH89301.1 TonB-dependent receptor [Flavivirga algicola]